MRFDEFVDVVKEIRDYLPKTFAEAGVELKTVTKNNGVELTGLIIRREASNICPTIYLDPYYEAYKAGEEMDKILREIADTRMRTDIKEPFDADQFMQFERVKELIVPRLVNKEQNSEQLTERPYSVLADLAVTYHIMLFNGNASTPVTNNFMKEWGIKTEELHETAIRNMLRLFPSTFRGMSVVVNELHPGYMDVLAPEDEALFVLSNSGKMFGAAAILDNKFLRGIAERMGKELYVLPSSIHELLVVTPNVEKNLDELKEMVTSTNASTLDPEERLSDHVYRYNIETGLEIAC